MGKIARATVDKEPKLQIVAHNFNGVAPPTGWQMEFDEDGAIVTHHPVSLRVRLKVLNEDWVDGERRLVESVEDLNVPSVCGMVSADGVIHYLNPAGIPILSVPVDRLIHADG